MSKHCIVNVEFIFYFRSLTTKAPAASFPQLKSDNNNFLLPPPMPSALPPNSKILMPPMLVLQPHLNQLSI